jgi:hypothetical protein
MKEATMIKKALVTIVLTMLVLDNAGCFRVMETRRRTVAEIEGRDSANRIVALQTRDDRMIEFKPKASGKLSADKIMGSILRSVDIAEADVQSRQTGPSGNILQVQTKDGTSYSFLTEKHDLGRIVGRAYLLMTIPVSEVLAVWVKEADFLGTVALNGALVVLSLLVAAVILMHSIHFHLFTGPIGWTH